MARKTAQNSAPSQAEKPKHPGSENLRPWKPGQSGNPGGRPAIAKEIRDLAQCDSPEAYLKVAAIMRDDKHKNQLPAAIAILKIAGVSLNADAQPGEQPPPAAPGPVSDEQVRDVLGVH